MSTPPFLDSVDSKLCECVCLCECLVDVCAWQPEDRILVILLLNAQMETDDFCSLWANLHHHGQIIKHEREREGGMERDKHLKVKSIHAKYTQAYSTILTHTHQYVKQPEASELVL